MILNLAVCLSLAVANPTLAQAVAEPAAEVPAATEAPPPPTELPLPPPEPPPPPTDVPVIVQPTTAPTEPPPPPTEAPIVVPSAPPTTALTDEPTATPEPELTFAVADTPDCRLAPGERTAVASGASIDYVCTDIVALTGAGVAPANVDVAWSVRATIAGGWNVQLLPPAPTTGGAVAWTPAGRTEAQFTFDSRSPS